MIYINTGDKHNSLCLWNNSIFSSNYQCKFVDKDIIMLSIMYIEEFLKSLKHGPNWLNNS